MNLGILVYVLVTWLCGGHPMIDSISIGADVSGNCGISITFQASMCMGTTGCPHIWITCDQLAWWWYLVHVWVYVLLCIPPPQDKRLSGNLSGMWFHSKCCWCRKPLCSKTAVSSMLMSVYLWCTWQDIVLVWHNHHNSIMAIARCMYMCARVHMLWVIGNHKQKGHVLR